jgi:hypothetical protein
VRVRVCVCGCARVRVRVVVSATVPGPLRFLHLLLFILFLPPILTPSPLFLENVKEKK